MDYKKEIIEMIEKITKTEGPVLLRGQRGQAGPDAHSTGADG